MNIVTTSLCYPSTRHAEHGIFIQRRAEAVAAQDGTNVRVISPQPWCPLLRQGGALPEQTWPLAASYPRMFSLPGLSWVADGLAYSQTLSKSLQALGGPQAIDLIDAHFEYPDGVGAWLAGRKLGLPVVVTVRGKIVSLSRRALRRAQIAAMLRGVDARIAVSESLAKWVRLIGGSDLTVDVIPNGVEPATFHPVDREQSRAALGFSSGARYLLAVGHLQHVKGFDRIVSVLPSIRAQLGDVRLVLAGSCRGERGFRRRLRHLISRCGGAPAVTFAGPVGVESLNLMYNAADLLVNASRSEGWNNAMSEALAAGLPVVATDVGGNAEQICSPQLGRIVPDGDQKALSAAIVQALDARWNRVLIAAHGGARTWVQVARDVRTVFARVLAARASRVQPVDSSNPLLALEVPR